jgi:hypothetical protein
VGSVTGAALALTGRYDQVQELEHAELREWRAFLSRLGLGHYAIKKQTHLYRHFRDRWPDLAVWAAEPLEIRLGRVRGQDKGAAHTDPVSYRARAYLKYLALTGRAAYDWDFVLASDTAGMIDYGDALGLPFNRAWLAQQRQEGTAFG